MTLRSTSRRAVRCVALALVMALPSGAQAPSDTTRICLAPATAQTASGSAADAATAVRAAFTSFLTGPSLTVTPLAARLASQAREEARQGGCPYVLFTALKHERKQGSNLLGRIAGGAVESGAGELRGAAGSAAGRVAAGAAASAASAATQALAGNVKAKDELTLEYRLETLDGAVVVKNSSKAKASSDGQDLLTPLVERAAETVAGAATRPRSE